MLRSLREVPANIKTREGKGEKKVHERIEKRTQTKKQRPTNQPVTNPELEKTRSFTGRSKNTNI